MEEFPPEEELDDLRAFREVVLVGWQSLFEHPRGARRKLDFSLDVATAVELLPGKSLDTRPDGTPWRHDMERLLTPASLEDLGDVCIGEAVEDFLPLLHDTMYETLPYHVSVATRSILAVQHEPGFRPTTAPFMFVGQRQHVRRVFALPWTLAMQLTETLPEAQELGPVLVIQMTGRCGSTVLSKAMEWLDVGCQSVSEPEIVTDIHEMLERGLCDREEAVKVLRAALLMLVHQRRKAQPDKPMVIIKNRSLSCCWRHCELLPEALPGVKQVFQWRNLEDVVGSFHVAVEAATVSPTTRLLQRFGRDSLVWSLNGSPVVLCMKRMVKTMREDPALASPLMSESHLHVDEFKKHGSLGFQALRCMLCAHASAVLGQKGLWSYILSYEDLMERRSACVKDLLDGLGWLHLVPNSKILGTEEGNKVFLKDAHSGGGLTKASGSTLGGDTRHLQATAKRATAERRDNAHLSAWQAEIVHNLFAQHQGLGRFGYDLSLASSVPTAMAAAGGA